MHIRLSGVSSMKCLHGPDSRKSKKTQEMTQLIDDLRYKPKFCLYKLLLKKKKQLLVINLPCIILWTVRGDFLIF